MRIEARVSVREDGTRGERVREASQDDAMMYKKGEEVLGWRKRNRPVADRRVLILTEAPYSTFRGDREQLPVRTLEDLQR
jgi:hypothetical protein